MNSKVISLFFFLFLFYSIEFGAARVASNDTVNSTEAMHGGGHRSVLTCGNSLEWCDTMKFNNKTPIFKSAETVRIVEQDLYIQQYTSLCVLFPNVRSLELDFDYLEHGKFLDCECSLLDELIVGGKLLHPDYEGLFENFLRKNSRIKQLTLKGPTSYKTYELIRTYLQNLLEISIIDSIVNEYALQHYIVIPSVRRLEISFSLETGCHPPMKIDFGGWDLKALHLECNEYIKNADYFATMTRYPHITSLYAGVIQGGDVLQVAGKLPKLIMAKFMVFNITSGEIVKFLENRTHFQELQINSDSPLLPDWREKLEADVGDDYIVSRAPIRADGTPFDYTFRVARKNDDDTGSAEGLQGDRSSALPLVTSGSVSFFIGIHIFRGLFF